MTVVAGVAPPSAVASVDRHVVFFGDSDQGWGTYEANSDGSDPRLLSSYGAGNTLSVSPDGRSLATSDINTIRIVDLGDAWDRHARTIYTAPIGDGFSQPRWSPDGSKLVFTDDQVYVDGSGNLVINSFVQTINADGTDLTTIAANSSYPGDQYASPDFSPDGRKVTYAGSVAGHPDETAIYVVNADGSDPVQLTDPAELNWPARPRFSPDGTRIALTNEDASWNWNIWTIDADGSNAQQLTHGVDAWAPAWTPGGSKIVFDDQTDTDYGLYSISADGAGTEQPFVNSAQGFDYASTVSFSPAGSTSFITDARYLEANFAPFLQFDSSEQWRPLSVDTFMHEVDPVHFLHTYNQICTFGCADIPTDWEQGLRDRPDGVITMGKLDGQQYPTSPYADCFSGVVKECDSGARTAMYAHVTPAPDEASTSGYHFVDYWLFYRFNQDQNDPLIHADDHQGDWEGLTVAPSLDNPRAFDFVIMAQHADYSNYLPSVLQCDALGGDGSCGTDDAPSGQRVWDFVATGTHASYPRYDDGGRTGICTQDQETDFPEGCHDGAATWGANFDVTRQLEFPPTSDWQNDPSTGSWVDWPGRWGGNGPDAFGLGGSPTSPGTHKRFQCPWNIAYPYIACTSSLTRFRADSARAKTSFATACPNWAGGMVVGAVCSPSRLRTAVRAGRMGRRGHFRILLAGRHGPTASAPGVAQAIGAPLAPGARLRVSGTAPQDALLMVRAKTHGNLTQAVFTDLGLERGGEGRLVVRAAHGHASLMWITPTGARVLPTASRTSKAPVAVGRSSGAKPRRGRGSASLADRKAPLVTSPGRARVADRACHRTAVAKYIRSLIRARRPGLRDLQRRRQISAEPQFRC
jgi:Tol biopolymer transport system component